MKDNTDTSWLRKMLHSRMAGAVVGTSVLMGTAGCSSTAPSHPLAITVPATPEEYTARNLTAYTRMEAAVQPAADELIRYVKKLSPLQLIEMGAGNKNMSVNIYPPYAGFGSQVVLQVEGNPEVSLPATAHLLDSIYAIVFSITR
jgi:hypothetical protein